MATEDFIRKIKYNQRLAKDDDSGSSGHSMSPGEAFTKWK